MGLLNIWRHRISQLFYPKDIIPKLSYKGEIDFTALLKGQQVYLLRRSNFPTFEETFKSNGAGGYEVNEDALAKKPTSIVNLSTNIYGTFKEKHLKFRLSHKKYGGQKWDEKKVDFIKNISSIMEPVDGVPIYIDANKIHDKPKTYSKPLSSQDELNKFLEITGSKPLMIIGKPPRYEFSATAKIVHDPLNFNYWHAEYSFINFDQNALNSLSNKWGEKFCEDVLGNILSINCYPNIQNQEYDIDKSFYLKKSS